MKHFVFLSVLVVAMLISGCEAETVLDCSSVKSLKASIAAAERNMTESEVYDLSRALAALESSDEPMFEKTQDPEIRMLKKINGKRPSEVIAEAKAIVARSGKKW